MIKIAKPKFKSCFRVETLGAEGAFLLSERNSVLLKGSLHRLLIPLIDGHHTVEEIIDKLHEQVDAIAVYSALMHMEQKGYLIESENQLPTQLVDLCASWNLNANEAYQRLQTTKVTVTSLAPLSTKEFVAILEGLQIQVAEDGDIEVVLTDDYLRGELDIFNQKAILESRSWMLVKPVGTIVWIGPIFNPEKTGCWECLAQRLRGNRPVEIYIQQRQGTNTPLTPPLISLPSTLSIALGMAATELFKWIIRGVNPQLEGRLISYDTLSLETKNHILVKRPQCSKCGSIQDKPEPIILKQCKKTFTADGGHRSLTPEETVKRYEHHISPITGVIRELKKLHQSVNGLNHTYLAKHNFTATFDSLNTLSQNIEGSSAGKGKTRWQSQASGLGEALERYSGVFQGDEIRKKGSYQQLVDIAIHPNTCMNFSPWQYEQRQQWNLEHPSLFQKVPEPFDETQEIDWTPVWSLTQQEFKYLPTAYCYMGYPQSSKPDCWADSNGCAAGNTLEEAILQGFMELVERDSVAIWWYNRLTRPKVNLDSFNEPYISAIQDYYRTLQRELWVLDITSDLNIPTFAAISRKKGREVEDIIFGFGTHFDPQIAILRALTEANQMLLSVLTTDTKGNTQYPPLADLLGLKWWKTATLQSHPYLLPDANIPPKFCQDYPQVFHNDLREDIMYCQNIIAKQGMEMLILDQTRPDIGMKVVKVIVPGLRHFWKRLGQGRLYNIPVQLGWLSEPYSESQLNPFPMWI